MRRQWSSHRGAVMWGGAVVMAATASIWLGYESYRFFWQPKRIGPLPIHPGALDLRNFHSVLTTWFSGKSVFSSDAAPRAVYPPASMVLLWPVYGWESLATATFAWTVTGAAAWVWVVGAVVRETGADRPEERAFAALMPLAIYPTGATIGNGQITLHILAALLAGLLLLRERPQRWRRDLPAALLVLFALAKPTLAAPFFWIVVFAARSLRPAIVVCVAYVVLTLLAASFQELGAVDLLRQHLGKALELGVSGGESNLHSLLVYLGRPEWMALSSLAILFLFGIWVWRHRDRDDWLLMGVAAFVARFWTYHRWYDDLLILLPMVALFRLAKRGASAGDTDVVAGLLLGLTLILMMAPGGLFLLPAPWNGLLTSVEVAVWIADLAFLVIVAHREKRPGASARRPALPRQMEPRIVRGHGASHQP